MTSRPAKRLGRPPANDSAETRERILGAAQRAFARRGFDATTNKDVAAEVGITTGAIYHYFDSKIDLYIAVYAELQDRVYGEFEKAVVPCSGFVERMCATLDAAVELDRDDPSIAAFVVNVPNEADRHPDLAVRVAPLQGRGRQFVRNLVDEAVARGEIAAGVEAQAVTDMVNSVLSGLARYSTVMRSAQRHHDATDALKRLFSGTLVLTQGRTTGTTAAR